MAGTQANQERGEGLSEYQVVRSKPDFVRRYAAGEFGNKVRTWPDVESYLADKTARPDKPVHLRNSIAGGATWYNVAPADVPAVYTKARESGLGRYNIYVSEMAPEHRKVFQGEVIRGATGPRLYYNCQALPMREGFAVEEKWAGGTQAMRLLENYLCPKSFDWLNVLFDRYPGHAIEFSTYDCNVGDLPGFNTIFWEVRTY